MNSVFQFFSQFLSKDLAVLLTSATPIVEIRGAIPLALALGIPVGKAFILGVIGNILPIIPVLLLLEPLTRFLTAHSKTLQRFFDWFWERTLKKSGNIEKYGAIGLMIFTAIPLPGTGAWSACVAAQIFRIPFYLAFPAISVGVVLAGMLITLLFGTFF